ncbi:polysaccharide biosynthesis tyrosine autokinase [Georgenia sp. Z1491]|uniref:polysaccharide biosynthesis tyrosine autokinase n=1 Tax=Georgenia sp. Z1491 TaxID=3416707 RepID=UPI003CF843CB
MELTDYVAVLRRRWPIVLVVTLLCLAASLAASLLATPRYTTSSEVFFAVQGGDSVSDLAQGSTFAQRQMTSFAEVATSPLVLEPVIEELGLDMSAGELAGMVTVSVPQDTVILEVSTTSTSPDDAARISNAVAGQLASTSAALSSPDGGETAPVQATVMTPAQVPGSPSSPDVVRNGALGLVLGLLLGLGAAFVRHLADTRVHTEEDIAGLTEVPVIAAVAVKDNAERDRVFVHDEPHGPSAEAVRRLRTNLQFVDLGDGPSSIVVTSSLPGEGKSTTAINLAASLADTGARVLLIDADLRRPSVAEYLGLEGGVGLTTVLIGRASLEDVVQPWQSSSLDILPTGQIPPNPSELLGSQSMRTLLAEATESYDAVLLDSPPILPVTDATVLSGMTGGTLVVAGADQIHKGQLADSLESLEAVETHVLGIVLNRVARSNSRYSYAYGGYKPLTEDDAPRPEPITRAGAPRRATSAPRRNRRTRAAS